MTKHDRRFDELTKLLGRNATRRAVFKTVIATAVGGVSARFIHQEDETAEAAVIRLACLCVGQTCSSAPGALPCCSSLTCDANTHTCRAGQRIVPAR